MKTLKKTIGGYFVLGFLFLRYGSSQDYRQDAEEIWRSLRIMLLTIGIPIAISMKILGFLYEHPLKSILWEIVISFTAMIILPLLGVFMTVTLIKKFVLPTHETKSRKDD